MATAEPRSAPNLRRDRGAQLTLAVTALALLVPVFVIGGQHTGVRAGGIFTLIVLIAAAVFGRVAYQGKLPRPFNGAGVLLMMTAFAGLSVLSVGWSLLPADSYLAAVSLIAYTALVALAALAAQLVPGRAREVAIGLGLAATVIAAYALISRVFPSWFPASDEFARLRMPFEYWNAVGSVAVFGIVVALWLGSSRAADRWLVVASYPAGGICFVALLLSQSRGALVAAIAVTALWLLLVDRRLRSVAWLAAVIAIGSIVVTWAYSQPALSLDMIALAERKSTGLTLGVVLLVMIALLGFVGWTIENRRRSVAMPEAQRQAVGKALLIALAIAPFVLLGAIAVKADKGLGAIPDRASALFEGTTTAPANSPDRLTQTNSLRARYWNDAFKVFDEHKWRGTGADTYSVSRLPFRTDTIQVLHAHGFVPQVMSDLGILGLITVLILAGVWLLPAFRVAGAQRRSPTLWLKNASDLRLAEFSFVLVALAFGVHSAVDWTWFIPGVAAFGLVTAGWVAGSLVGNPRHEPATLDESQRMRATRAALIGIVGVAMAFAIYQPVRADRMIDDGYAVIDSDPAEALRLGEDAHDLNPTSDDAFFLVSAAQNNLGKPITADQTLLRVAVEQPGNPETWLRLAEFRLNVLKEPGEAISALLPLLYQSPNNAHGVAMLAQAKADRTSELLEEKAERERRKLERELKDLQRELETNGFSKNPAR